MPRPWLSALLLSACTGSLVRYVDVPEAPRPALERLRDEARLGGFHANPRREGLVAVDSDGGFSGEAFAAALPDGGSRLELRTTEGGPRIWDLAADATLHATSPLDPGHAFPFAWDLGFAASVAGATAGGVTWRGDGFARGGYAFRLTDDRVAIAPMLGVGVSALGDRGFAFRPQVALALSWQRVAEEISGRPVLLTSRWQAELAAALLLKDAAQLEAEAELCLASSSWGGPCARVGSQLTGRPGLTWSVGYRFGAEPSVYIGGAAVMVGLVAVLVIGVVDSAFSAWKPGGG